MGPANSSTIERLSSSWTSNVLLLLEMIFCDIIRTVLSKEAFLGPLHCTCMYKYILHYKYNACTNISGGYYRFMIPHLCINNGSTSCLSKETNNQLYIIIEDLVRGQEAIQRATLIFMIKVTGYTLTTS